MTIFCSLRNPNNINSKRRICLQRLQATLLTSEKRTKDGKLIGCGRIGYIRRQLQPMPPDIPIRFGRAIRRVRERQGISQEEAAERCGLHRTYYSGIERGRRNVSLVNIERISKGLRVSLLKLFSRLS